MRTTQQMSITLPNDMANVVKSKVQAGEYASESEVIRDGLRALIARDRAVETQLSTQVAKGHAAVVSKWDRTDPVVCFELQLSPFLGWPRR